MIASPARRVRHLRLHSSSEELARRGVILLEDAFHTASLPFAEDSRVWIVRRLVLGEISSLASTATIALAIEQQFRRMDTLAVHAEDPAAGNAAAVYFRDRTEPFRCLARRLLTQTPTTDWFWPLALPNWRSDRSRPETWRYLIVELLRQPAGTVALASLLHESNDRDIADALFSALRPQDGPALLEICGWASPPTFETPRSRINTVHGMLPASWLHMVRQRSCDWGKEDARTLWLAAMALVAVKPTRLAQSDLVGRARDVIHASRAAPTEQGDTGIEVEDKITAVENISAIRKGRRNDALHLAPEPDLAPEYSIRTSRVISDQGEPNPYAAQASVRGGTGNEHLRDSADACAKEPRISSQADSPTPSCCAGVFLLVPLLERLHIQNFLDLHPDLIELEFPRRLLALMARRAGAPAHDPVLQCLMVQNEGAPAWPAEFHLPASWVDDLAPAGEGRVYRVEGRRRSHVRCDATGRLVLECRQENVSDALSSQGQTLSLRRRTQAVCDDAEAILLNAWMTAVRRGCLRFAGLGWRDLVRRPGQIRLTRTHVDVYFDLCQADVRIRKAGFDLDPGWRPWLGRLIQFHYVSGGHGHRS